MPLIVALILSLGTFTGYVTIQSGAADKVLQNIEPSVNYTPLVINFQCREGEQNVLP